MPYLFLYGTIQSTDTASAFWRKSLHTHLPWARGVPFQSSRSVPAFLGNLLFHHGTVLIGRRLADQPEAGHVGVDKARSSAGALDDPMAGPAGGFNISIDSATIKCAVAGILSLGFLGLGRPAWEYERRL